MRCLNTYVGLNVVETNIVDKIPQTARRGIVVGAGDGRLARAIQKKLGENTHIAVIEPRTALQRYMTDIPAVGSDPWDLEWYRAQAGKEGLDFIIFYNIHEYWKGNVARLNQILQLVKFDGHCWLSFFNGSSRRALERNLPPVPAGLHRLAHPMDLAPRMDISSWAETLKLLNCNLEHLWGLMEDDAFEYCRSNDRKPTDWKIKDLSLKVGAMGDAYMWGASFVLVQFGAPDFQGRRTDASEPTFSVAPFHPQHFQSLMFAYPEAVSDEVSQLIAEVDVANWRKEPSYESGKLLDFFMDQVKSEKVKKVLVLGCGWGRIMLLMKKLHPEWDITGMDESAERIEIARDLIEKEGMKIMALDSYQPLPFEDGAFDTVLSVNHFSSIYQPMAKHLAKEVIRVSSSRILHLEDGRGPEFSMHLRRYELVNVYNELGQEATKLPLAFDDQPSGMYILKVTR